MEETRSYWHRTLSRRQALRAGGVSAGGVAALSLIGCGSDDKSSSPASSSGATSNVDSTQGKPGGSFKLGQSGYPTGFNPITSSTTIYTTAGLSYSGLLGHKWGQQSVGIFDYFDLE